VFPPSASTILGALRTALLVQLSSKEGDAAWTRYAESKKAWQAIGGTGSRPPFGIGPVLLGIRRASGAPELLWPAPLDLVVHTQGDKIEAGLLRPIERHGGGACSLPDNLAPLGVLSSRRFAAFSGWLTSSEISTCLAGRAPAPCETKLWEIEPRVGIGLSPDKTAREGMFYQMEALRLAPGVCLLVRVEGEYPLQAPVHMRLGGQGRTARIEDAPVPHLPQAPGSFPSGRIKAVLTSPAVWPDGWKPPRQDGLRLVAAATGRPAQVGGWDLQAQRPRPLRRAAPAGSVYFFEGSEAAALALASTGFAPMLSEEDRALGLGSALFGVW
jgi:CRISPR-associated protein Cmr3